MTAATASSHHHHHRIQDRHPMNHHTIRTRHRILSISNHTRTRTPAHLRSQRRAGMVDTFRDHQHHPVVTPRTCLMPSLLPCLTRDLCRDRALSRAHRQCRQWGCQVWVCLVRICLMHREQDLVCTVLHQCRCRALLCQCMVDMADILSNHLIEVLLVDMDSIHTMADILVEDGTSCCTFLFHE